MDAGSQERMATTRAGKADSKLISMIPFLPESASKTKIFHLSRQNRASLLRSKLQCKVNLTQRERERERFSRSDDPENGSREASKTNPIGQDTRTVTVRYTSCESI